MNFGFLKTLGMAVCIVGFLAILVVKGQSSPAPGGNARQNSAPELMSRSSLKSKLQDGYVSDGQLGYKANTLNQVVDLLGPPDSTQESGKNKYVYYRHVSRDELSGKTDTVQLVFELATDRRGFVEKGRLDYYLTSINFN